MKKRIPEDTEHSGSDRYLITYADLITLLLGLFVILYASSQTDSSKYREVSQAMKAYFEKNNNGVLPGGKGILPAASRDTTFKNNDEIAQEIQLSLKGFLTTQGVEVEQNSTQVIVKLPEQLLFKPGKSDVEVLGRIALDSVAAILSGITQNISIDGHTDSIPVRTFQYESNWHLSVDRAVTVGYYLLQRGLPKEQTLIRGFGSERPAAPNSTLEGRAKNRRVEIIISQSESSEKLLKDTTSGSQPAQNERFFQN